MPKSKAFERIYESEKKKLYRDVPSKFRKSSRKNIKLAKTKK